MAYKKFANTQPAALSAAATNSDTTLYLVDGSSFPDPAVGGNGPYTVLVGYGTSREEVCTVTAKPGTNILTVTRGEDGSSATSKNIGDVVVHGVSKRDWDDLLPKAGGTMSGAIAMGSQKITGLAAGTADGEAVHWGQLAAKRNRVCNGNFAVNQRGFSSVTAGNTIGFDRWMLGAVGGTVTYSAQTPALGDLPESATAFARIVTSGQSAAGDYALLLQKIESVRTLSGKTATISFWAKAASGTPKVAVEVVQNFGSGGSPSAAVNTYVGQVTLSTSWARYSVTVAVPSISGKTLGSAGDDTFIVQLWTSAGSTFNARTGTLGFQSVTIDFWGVQVEEGSVATPFEVEEYGENLRRCQRYFFLLPAGSTYSYLGAGINNDATHSYFCVAHPVPMRTIPSCSLTGTAVVMEPNVNVYTVTALSAAASSSTHLVSFIDATVASGLTAGRATLLRLAANAYLSFSAEL